MKRSSRGPGGPSGLLAGLILVLATVLATALAAGCGPGAPTGQSAPPTGQPHDHSASPAPSESCGGASASAGGAGASPRQPVLSAVQFVSASVGWVVGSDRIMHTADGLRHWAVQFRTSQANQLRTLDFVDASIDFVDASHGWVTGTSELLTTTDGGAHWRALPEPCRAIGAVHFVSPDVGFAMAGGNLPAAGAPSGPRAGGAVVRTTDAGQHWQPVATPPGVQSVCFSGTRRGWLGADGNIYGTVNGGRGWTLAVRGAIQARGPPGGHALAQGECARSGAGRGGTESPRAAPSDH